MRQGRRSVIGNTDEGGAMDRKEIFQYKATRVEERHDVRSEATNEGALGKRRDKETGVICASRGYGESYECTTGGGNRGCGRIRSNRHETRFDAVGQ